MKKGEMKKDMREIFRMSFKCGVAAGVNYALQGKEVADKGIFQENVEKIADEYETMALLLSTKKLE